MSTEAMRIQVYIVHYHEERLIGYEETDRPAHIVRKLYEVAFDLRGKTAHFLVLSNDLGLTRLDAISFAHSIAQGKFRKYHIDLLPLQCTKNGGLQVKP